jgi:uncharacterized protein with von Willebrand factor type A (vWA) domain
MLTTRPIAKPHNNIAQMYDKDIADTVMLRIMGFVQHARANNFKVGVAEEFDALNIASISGATNQYLIKAGLKGLFCSNEDDWKRFDELFDGYFHLTNMKTQYRESPSGVLNKKPKETKQQKAPSTQTKKQSNQSVSADSDAGVGDDEEQGDGSREGASLRASIAKADFQSLTDPEQMREVERLVERLAKRMRRRLSRRQKIQKKGQKISMRATMRSSLRYGGEPLELKYMARAKKQSRLIIIIDVSRSMSMYSFFFLRFARGLMSVFKDVSVFAYHTHLLPITEALKQTDLMRVRNSLAMMSDGWSGGTKIGESLQTFNQKYGQLMNSRTVTFIVSDGLDTGSSEDLVKQLECIKQRSKRLVWLNPLIGRTGYEPKTQAMLKALPLIDLFAPAHNLESLAALETELTQL